MRERLEAAFEYVMDRPEAIMLMGGIFLAFISVFTVIDGGTTSFLRVLSVALIASGIILYVLRLGLRFLIRVFCKIFKI